MTTTTDTGDSVTIDVDEDFIEAIDQCARAGGATTTDEVHDTVVDHLSIDVDEDLDNHTITVRVQPAIEAAPCAPPADRLTD